MTKKDRVKALLYGYVDTATVHHLSVQIEGIYKEKESICNKEKEKEHSCNKCIYGPNKDNREPCVSCLHYYEDYKDNFKQKLSAGTVVKLIEENKIGVVINNDNWGDGTAAVLDNEGYVCDYGLDELEVLDEFIPQMSDVLETLNKLNKR